MNMRKYPLLSSLACVLFLSIVMVPFGAAQAANTYNGEITDEHLNCIQTPIKAPDGVKQKDACVLYWAHFVQPREQVRSLRRSD